MDSSLRWITVLREAAFGAMGGAVLGGMFGGNYGALFGAGLGALIIGAIASRKENPHG